MQVQRWDKVKAWVYGLVAAALVVCAVTIMPRQFTHAATTDATWTKVKQSGVLRVGLSPDYAPYEFHSTAGGKDQIVGFDVTMDKLLAKRLSVKLKLVEMSNDALLSALESGKVDIVVSGITPTAEREKKVDFTDVYFNDPNVVLVQKQDAKKYQSLNDFKGAKIGAQITTIQEDQAKKYLHGATVTSLKKVTDEAAQLSQGKLDGIVVPTTTAKSYELESDKFATAPVKIPGGGGESAIVLPKNSPVLKAKLNQILHKEVIGKPITKWRNAAMKQMVQKESFFHKYAPYFVKGTEYTLALAVIGVTVGFVLGTLLAMMKRSRVWIVKAIANVYIEFVRGTPLLIQVFIVYFGTQIIGLNVSGFVSGAIAMFLNSGAYVAEIIRSGLNAVPVGQGEASRSLGLSGRQTMQLVVLPQALRTILPALGNEFVSVIKEGSVVSVIGVGELTFQTSVVQGASFEAFLPLIVTACIYFVLTFGLTQVLHMGERHYSRERV
ncbi:ABC transporter substrate-binding protein/permease [Lacticaseibacillus pantheris]|uniref:ABC transporter substrate-binding protein/permease n=1 Tax=Lacticaseibacillus pantheris TaxID=171523 RepID=UPI00259955DB|nr:ABC transporter substrate-binding protein/permease [Lacticaseibacillus pantheris]WKF85593.1 ABC transporter substrate-binding protein/permease [Lacticaseibacillus pantheris]